MGKKIEIYVLDIKTGIVIKKNGYDEMIELTGISSRGALSNAIFTGYAHKGRYIYKKEKFTKAEKLERYNAYWSKRETELTGERWRKATQDILVSNYGRIKVNNKPYFPVLRNGAGSLSIIYNKSKINILRLMAELFVVKRKLKKSEVVVRINKGVEYEPNNLKVITTKDYYMRGVRAVSREVAKINYKGEILEIYRSIREAERENNLGNGTIGKALKKDGLCAGMQFVKMDEIY